MSIIATAEVTAREDDVWLIDSGSGRIVMALTALPLSVRRQLDSRILDPRLQGEVRVPGIEKMSATSRSGMEAKYWQTEEGKTVIRLINPHSWSIRRVRKTVARPIPSRLSDP